LQDRRQTWYFVASGTKLADVYNILHLPYTAMVLGFVLAGAATAPQLHADRIAGALLAYFIGLGIGAHALDQLEPGGSSYVRRLSRSELEALAVFGLGGAAAVGLYFAFTVTVWLVPFIAAGLFFAVAYPLPSRVGGRLFHNEPGFSFSWGFLPFVTSYFVNSVSLTPFAVVGGLVAALAAAVEIRLSRRARNARKDGIPAAEYEGPERGLKVLVASTCCVAILLMVARVV
jgi:hypothetical protein